MKPSVEDLQFLVDSFRKEGLSLDRAYLRKSHEGRLEVAQICARRRDALFFTARVLSREIDAMEASK